MARDYAASTPGSARIYERARKVFPDGVTHDSRVFSPHPIYVTRADGCRKWDVDGNEYIDYWMGHGALLLGFNPPAVVRAVQEQVARASHYGSCHELEVQWGELVHSMVPCAELVRFTSSGTEATLMAFRLARAFTKREKVLRFHGHFHGWHDYGVVGIHPPYEVPSSPGVPQGVQDSVIHVQQGDIAAVEAALQRGDVACVILEPAGGFTATIPLIGNTFLQQLREVTRRHGTLLIFDEVVTGFRLAPGGAQEYYGVTPDLCTMAKALTGGVPGGAGVAGRADVMAHLGGKAGDAHWNRYEKIYHPGTFNANPLTAAAAVAALQLLKGGEVQRHASAMGSRLRRGLNGVIRRRGIEGIAYGIGSIFHIHFGPGAEGDDEGTLSRYDEQALLAGAKVNPVVSGLRKAMLEHGVDFHRGSGRTSWAHQEKDIDETVAAFDAAMDGLLASGIAQAARR